MNLSKLYSHVCEVSDVLWIQVQTENQCILFEAFPRIQSFVFQALLKVERMFLK